ncbi:hypothetical protein P8C59_003187 [Phyllachora maydis]|uniref:Uncharacterized protein n=1 Tax=Phyllachora maydis TaxID=1825666 RepID=A0AAD9HZS2_9PEZI|nr:hypothetical protein P8C59_003187 [Phyllachora maydis]
MGSSESPTSLRSRPRTRSCDERDQGGADVLNSGDNVPWHFAATVLDYARMMKGTGAYMEEQHDLEIENLQKQEKEDELLFHEGNEWTQKAIMSIKAAKEKTQGLGEAELALDKLAANIGHSPQSEQDFYFYMTPPHVYLSPLDIRILKTKFGAFSAMPSTLLPRVEHISTGHSVDDALRKRARYFSHLPQGCLISFLECDWTDIVPADILDTFADELARRRKRNQDKAVQEERERVQAERIEAAALRGARRNLGAVDEEVTVRFSASVDGEGASINPSEFLPLGAVGMTPPNPRSGFSHLQNISTSPSANRTVWGTVAVPVSPEIDPVREQPTTDDGWLKDGDVLETLDAAEVAVQMGALGLETPTEGQVAGGSTGKKKKKQKITLMTNGGRRGN